MKSVSSHNEHFTAKYRTRNSSRPIFKYYYYTWTVSVRSYILRKHHTFLTTWFVIIYAFVRITPQPLQQISIWAEEFMFDRNNEFHKVDFIY